MKKKLLAGLGLTAALALAVVVGAGTVVALDNGPPANVNPKTTAIIDYVSPEFGGPQHPGPHGNGDEEPTPTPEPTHDEHFTLLGGVWADANTTTLEVDPKLAFQIDLRGFPAGSGPAILAAFASWESETKGDLFDEEGSSFNNVVVDFGDDINTYSMRNLGGRVLAATFITFNDVNSSGVLDTGDVFLEMDVVFNSTVKWAIAPSDAKGKWFDVENVAAHEDGHVFGMGHVGNGIHTLDRDKEQTMFVSAAPEETKQRSLEPDGDILAAVLLYGGP